jgi:hypothetical protein
MSVVSPNWFAIAAFFAWPLVTLGFFLSRQLQQAILWTLLGAQLLLPAKIGFKFPMVPQLDKDSISILCALLGCMLVSGRSLRVFPKLGVPSVLILVSLIVPLITSLLNDDPIRVGDKVLPGVGWYDGLSAVLSQFILLTPYFLGRQFFSKNAGSQDILVVLVTAGTAYSILLLFEVRFSPQLHYWFYGYYPSDFIQTVREDGGFRPMAFMGHGLVASFFAMTAAVASVAFWRNQLRLFPLAPGLITGYLTIVLVLCKSTAALIYGTLLIPLVRWGRPIFQIRVAIILVTLALLYPVLRVSGVFPTTMLVETAMSFSAPRGNSLKFRFDQEDQLLARAWQRPIFGWGRYGRNHVYVEDYRGVGGVASVTDGRWIITFGQFGILGFLAEFGLLAYPVFRVAAALRVITSSRERLFLAAHALIVAINVIELLPNSTLTPWSWLLAGALLGRSEVLGLVRHQYKRPSAEMRLSLRETQL